MEKFGPDAKATAQSQMEAAIDALSRELGKLRTGRASAGDGIFSFCAVLTKEHVQAVCKVVAKASEEAKQSIRRARQKALDTIKKAVPKKKDKDRSGSVFSKDDANKLEKQIDELTKKFIKSAEDARQRKRKQWEEAESSFLLLRDCPHKRQSNA